MHEKTLAVTKEQALTFAVLIDDAYDEPKTRNVFDEFPAFYDSLKTDKDYTHVATVLGVDVLTQDKLGELLEDDKIIAQLYAAKSELPEPIWSSLFKTFVEKQAVKKLELLPIIELLESLGFGVTCRATSAAEVPQEPPDLILVDLFLDDTKGQEEAADDAAAKIEPFLPKGDDEHSPLVVLISAQEVQLDAVNERFRECASVPGCRFVFIAKRKFKKDPDEVLFRLHQLFAHAGSSAQFDVFTRQMATAAKQANDSFIALLKRFELSDYADLVDLVTRAEGVPLQQYLMDLLALSWSTFAESDERLVAAFDKLGELGLDIDNYPPNALAPSDAVLEIYQRALYRPAVALPKLESFNNLALGDILQQKDAGAGPPVLYLVIAQDCDMLQGDPPDSAFLIKGKVDDAPVVRDVKAKVFPYSYYGTQYTVKWEMKRWRSLRQCEFEKFLQHNDLERVHRLRPPWSISRQSELLQYLSRPAEIAVPFAVHGVDLQVLARRSNGHAQMQIDFDDNANGFLLIGRRGDDPVTRLVMSTSFAGRLRAQLREFLANRGGLSDQTADWLEALLNTPDSLEALRGKLERHPKGNKKPQDDVLPGVGLAATKDAFYTTGQNPGPVMHLMINAQPIDQDAEEE